MAAVAITAPLMSPVSKFSLNTRLLLLYHFTMNRAFSRSHPTCDAIKYQALHYFTQYQSMLLSSERRMAAHRA